MEVAFVPDRFPKEMWKDWCAIQPIRNKKNMFETKQESLVNIPIKTSHHLEVYGGIHSNEIRKYQDFISPNSDHFILSLPLFSPPHRSLARTSFASAIGEFVAQSDGPAWNERESSLVGNGWWSVMVGNYG